MLPGSKQTPATSKNAETQSQTGAGVLSVWVQNFLSQNFLATVAEIRRLGGMWRMPRWLLQEEGKRREQVQAQVRTPGGKMSTLLTDDSIFPVKCERPSLESRDRDSLEEEEDRVKSCSGGRAS